MLIINGGIPRSGTVLVGNLIRLMLESRGIRWARYNPQEPRHMPDFLKTVQTAPAQPVLIIHTHLINQDILNAIAVRDDAILLWNHRDPRDALVSLAKLHDLDLPRALHAIRIYAQAASIAVNTETCIEIRYDALTTLPEQHITQLGDALGFQLTTDEIAKLRSQTSVDAHASVMNQLRKGALPTARTLNTKKRLLHEDPKTLVNDRHIQSGKNGRWRTELRETQQAEVNASLARWISAFGYDQP